jgi:hypothetical protein
MSEKQKKAGLGFPVRKRRRRASKLVPVPADGHYWFRPYIPLRGGAYPPKWLIAHVRDGKVQPQGWNCWLEPTCDYLRDALWGPRIIPPLTGEVIAAALTQKGRAAPENIRSRKAEQPDPPALDSTGLLVLAEGIVRAFVEESGESWPPYQRHPRWLAELGRVWRIKNP